GASGRPELDVERLVEGRLERRAAGAGVAGRAGAGDAVDDAGVEVHHADGVVHRVRDVELAAAQRDRAGRGEALEEGELRLEGGAAVAGVADLAGPGDGVDHARRAVVDEADALVALVDQVDLIA